MKVEIFTEREIAALERIFGFKLNVKTYDNSSSETKESTKPDLCGVYHIAGSDNELRLKMAGYNNLDISKKEIITEKDKSFISIEFKKREQSSREVKDCRILVGLPDDTKSVKTNLVDGILYVTASVETKKPSIEIV